MAHRFSACSFARAVVICTLLATVMGCGHTVTVMEADDTPNKPQGYVPPLGDLIKQTGHTANVSKVKVIFIHGVGDHCPGYALGTPENTDHIWLSSQNMLSIGLAPAAGSRGTTVHWYKIPALSRQPEPTTPDAASWFAVATRAYAYTAEPGRTLPVEATEITWSGLTQWIKSEYLGYDTTNQAASTTQCKTRRQSGPGSPPGSREILNKAIKETLFDTALADAVLYMGPYRSPMQLAVAYGLCQAIGDTDSGCSWPSPLLPPKDNDTRYIFVTHSLGSRILYDVLRGLHGEGEVSALLENSGVPKPQTNTIDQVLDATPVIYMMANQVALLGLANLDATLQPGQKPIPFDLRIPLNLNTSGLLASLPAPVPQSQNERLAEKGGLRAFLHSELVQHRSNTLNIIAFNDVNDVLSWGIPPQYQHDTTSPDGVARVRITNVYVRNEPLLPWLLEMPVTAHTGYFDNKEVWRVISQGACGQDKSLAKCQKQGATP